MITSEAAERHRTTTVFLRADTALRRGRISQAEHDALLIAYYGTTDLQKALRLTQRAHTPNKNLQTIALIAGFTVVMLSLFVALFYATGGITAAVVMDHDINQTFNSNATLPLELVGATRINVSGLAIGEGNVRITLSADGTDYTLYEYQHGPLRTAHALLPKSRYTTGEQVVFTAENASAMYLMTSRDAVLLTNTTLADLAPGEYAIKLIINTTESDGTHALAQEALAFTVVANGTPTPSERFDDCGQACNVNITGNATIAITIEGDATIELGKESISTEGNHAPQLSSQIPDTTADSTAMIDLGAHFTDPDGDDLYFDTAHHDGMNETITGGILSITGMPGTYTYLAYASDLTEMTPSNIFSVTILESGTGNGTNATTGNNTLNGTGDAAINATGNTTGNERILGNESMLSNSNGPDVTTNASNETNTSNVTGVVGCDNPDPNQRPLECIQSENSTYFKPETLMLENKNAQAVGQLTPVGNLLLRGGLIERSNSTAAAWDYQLGYKDDNGDFNPTLWIDTATGDLHLRGSITEANGNIPQQEGYSAFVNERSIILALYQPRTGDLILRGNLVPYRRTIG